MILQNDRLLFFPFFFNWDRKMLYCCLLRWKMGLSAKECWWPLEAGKKEIRKQIFFLEPPEGAQPCLYFDFSPAAAKSLRLCPTLCDPIDGSPPGSPVPGILQARAWKWKVKVKSLSRVRLLVTPWTAAYQAPPSMRFSKQEYWSGVPLPSPELLC